MRGQTGGNRSPAAIGRGEPVNVKNRFKSSLPSSTPLLPGGGRAQQATKNNIGDSLEASRIMAEIRTQPQRGDAWGGGCCGRPEARGKNSLGPSPLEDQTAEPVARPVNTK